MKKIVKVIKNKIDVSNIVKEFGYNNITSFEYEISDISGEKSLVLKPFSVEVLVKNASDNNLLSSFEKNEKMDDLLNIDGDDIFFGKGVRKIYFGVIRYESEDKIVLLKGSRITLNPADSLNKNIKMLETEMLADGRLVRMEKYYETTEDYIFSSPSQAASFVSGSHVDGWTFFVDRNGKTLDEVYR